MKKIKLDAISIAFIILIILGIVLLLAGYFGIKLW